MERINVIATGKHPNRKEGDAHAVLEVHVERYVKNGWVKLAKGETLEAPKETITEESKEAETDVIADAKPKTKAKKQ